MILRTNREKDDPRRIASVTLSPSQDSIEHEGRWGQDIEFLDALLREEHIIREKHIYTSPGPEGVGFYLIFVSGNKRHSFEIKNKWRREAINFFLTHKLIAVRARKNNSSICIRVSPHDKKNNGVRAENPSFVRRIIRKITGGMVASFS